ncbi:class I SAM-dependent methyltransferase [Mesorhizobium sp. RCC_202]|jgi:ubiquinone/menaquinone biosynthesis C-methylase UbiE|uniref:class I SAM-dependent methyltransferase n=1 Tax=Mesorhizobium sp. RCC_202 TaxID=3239222 RepID=UPI0035263A8A
MNSQEVDRIKAFYRRWEPTYDHGNSGYLRSLDERNMHLKHLLAGFPGLARCRILDVGCGYGDLLNLFHQQGVSADGLVGIDLLPNRIETARQRYPDFTFKEANAEEIDFPDNYFDIVTVFTVFSSILDRNMAHNVARGIMRVLASGGVIVWYDMRYPNPWNRNIRPMTKRRISELFPSFELRLKALTLLPPLARHLGRGANSIHPLLSTVPILRSHYFGLLRPTR